MKANPTNSLYSILPYNHYGLMTIPHIDRDGDIFFEVIAHKKVKGQYTKKLTIMKISENPGKCFVRWGNLEFGSIGGWRVRFPGDAFVYYRDGQGEYEIYTMTKTTYDHVPGISEIRVTYLGEIEKLDPSLKYLAKALETKNIPLTIELIKAYRQHPQDVEMLIKAGYVHLATNKNMLKLKPEMKKKVYNELVNGTGNENLTSKELLCKVRHGVSTRLYTHLKKYKINVIKAKNYVAKNNEGLYIDYLTMASGAGKDLTEDYWAFPSNLINQHNKILLEVANIKEAKLKGEFSKLKKVSERLRKIYPPMLIDGYEIDFPKDMGDIIVQAESLHQCLIKANYHEQMIKKQTILVFVKKEGLPIATAEIRKDLSLGQFYGDELNRSDCRPSEEVRLAFGVWYMKNIKNTKEQGAQA